MKKIDFFIDTADEQYINDTWNYLRTALTGKEISGITTNPSAMSKCNIHTFEEFKVKVKNLCKLVSSIRQDNLGVVYVQHPDSTISIDDLKSWIDKILPLSDGQTKVGLKIPPYFHLLNEIEKYRNIIDINVTGVADCSTAMMCFTYSPRYVSLIPGRMEEVGVDANLQMKYIDQRNKNKKSELITGSMRTIDGLKSAILYNTVPTIGTRVFNQLFQTPIDEFINLWIDRDVENNYLTISPYVTESMSNLSKSFFIEMDKLGYNLAQNLKST